MPPSHCRSASTGYLVLHSKNEISLGNNNFNGITPNLSQKAKKPLLGKLSEILVKAGHGQQSLALKKDGDDNMQFSRVGVIVPILKMIKLSLR